MRHSCRTVLTIYIYVYLQSHRRLNGLSRPKSQVQFTCPKGGFGHMVKIEQMDGGGSTDDLMWSFTYEWNIMDVPMFFDFSSIKSLLPSISGTDVQKHVTCDDQNARW